MTILDVGCGLAKHPGATGIDVNPRSKADIIHDLNNLPYPFEDNSFHTVICQDVLEHLSVNFIALCEELHRISKPGAKLIVRVPHFTSANAFTDPTHVRFFTSRSFDYFVPGTDLAKFQYSSIQFSKIRAGLDSAGHSGLKGAVYSRVAACANCFLQFLETRAHFMLAPLSANLVFELQVIK